MSAKSILLVQDDGQSREAWDTVLTKHKFSVAYATQGTHALTILEKNAQNFDCLIIIDHFQDMPGQELISMTRSNFPALKIVMISSQPDPDEEEFAKVNGCDLYMPDYPDKNILLMAIQQLL